MIARIAALTALALVTACNANAGPYATPQVTPVAAALPAPEALACEVRATRTSHGVRVEAVAHARAAFDGAYEVVIRSGSNGNMSDIVQGGPVSLGAGAVATLGSSEIGAGQRGRARVVFTMRDQRGEQCRIERSV